jgi:DNA-binding NarL/FixJ family response regulator
LAKTFLREEEIESAMAVATRPLAPIFVVADDHPMVRDALALSLSSAFPGAHIEFAGSLAETLAAIERRPDTDLVILDLDMPGMNGMTGLAQLRSTHGAIPVAIVSAARSPALMRQAVEMGASGFIPKFTPSPEIAEAIREILAGAIWLPEAARDHQLAPNDADLALRAAQLTPQQHRVLALMAEGKPNKVIAFEMQITEPTVKSHVTEILRRLGVQSRTQAVIIAQKLAQEPRPSVKAAN